MIRRVVAEHEDGRRVSVDENEFDNAEHNPFNRGGMVVEMDANTGRSTTFMSPARAADDHVSLKSEGFVIVGVIDQDGHEQGLEG